MMTCTGFMEYRNVIDKGRRVDQIVSVKGS
jgi:hypothetical protein